MARVYFAKGYAFSSNTIIWSMYLGRRYLGSIQRNPNEGWISWSRNRDGSLRESGPFKQKERAIDVVLRGGK